MILQELSVGNWVCDGEKSIPMYVTSVHRDGTVYLDFPGNEALDWETDVKDLVPIEVTEEMLLNWGFKNFLGDIGVFKVEILQACIGNNPVEIKNLSNKVGADWSAHVDNEVCESIGSFDFQYVHELQNHICNLTGHPFEIKEIVSNKETLK